MEGFINFMTSVPVSAAMIIICFILFILLMYKGWSLIPAALVCSVLISLVANPGTDGTFFITPFFVDYIESAGTWFSNFFLIFISGGILANVMVISGCGRSIGEFFSKLIGADRAPYVVIILAFLFNMAGLMTTPLIVAPIAYVIMKEANLPKYIAMAALLGTMQPTASAFVYSPNSYNILPTSGLGTSYTAAPLMGLCCFAFAMILIILYVKFLVWDARKRGVGFNDGSRMMPPPEGKCPNVVLSIMPLIIVVGGTLGLSQGLGVTDFYALTIAQVVASLFVVLTCGKFFAKNKWKTMSEGIMTTLEFVVGVSLVTAFAGVVEKTTAFAAVQTGLSNSNIHPYLLTVICVALVSAMCVNGYTGMTIFVSVFSGAVLHTPGISADAVHRLTTMTSTTIDSLPHSLPAQLNLMAFGYNVKNGYKYCFMSTVVITTLYTLFGLGMALLFY